ncbi:MAG: TonB-dependent receptor family protein, partial [Bacteroidota bacterium]
MGQRQSGAIHQLPEIVGTNIYAGKKTALVVLDQSHGNLVSNTMRQLLAKVPGIFIWENESSGIQIKIAARGLSPNRSWEFNVRQNGMDIAADPYGYPEAYYNPQLQSVQRIEIVRGHGALQYGPQIGGMINYILKNGSEFSRPIQAEVWQTAGSNGLFNAYQAIGGKTNRLHYYAFTDYRRGDGWRTNNHFNSLTGSGNLTWKATDRLDLNVQFTRWNSTSQQPGGLTDQLFNANARQSLRGRNWMELDWTTAAVSGDLRITDHTRMTTKLFTILGDRQSVGFFPSGGIIIPDGTNPQTGLPANRMVDIDHYRNLGMETRLLTGFNTGRIHHHLSTGIRLFRGNTFRFRGGTGTSDADPNFSIDQEKGWNADINYNSTNAALHAEDLITLTPRLLVVPGFRLEYLNAQASGFSGKNNQGPIALIPQQRDRTFLLGGIGIEYLTSPSTRLYANATSSYRPVQFADLTTPPTTDVIDRNLQDAAGLNIDLGYRGKSGDRLLFDASLFLLDYRNRVGTVKQQREDGSFYNF